MVEIEQQSHTYKENLGQVQGNINMILELLRTYKDNTATAIETSTEVEMDA